MESCNVIIIFRFVTCAWDGIITITVKVLEDWGIYENLW